MAVNAQIAMVTMINSVISAIPSRRIHPQPGSIHRIKNEHSFLGYPNSRRSTRFLSPHSVPARLNGTGNEGIVQLDEPEDVIPRHGQERTKGQGKEDGQRNILQDLLGNPFFEQIVIDIAFLPHPQEAFPTERHPVGRVVKLLQITEIEGIVNKVPEQRRAEMEKPFSKYR